MKKEELVLMWNGGQWIEAARPFLYHGQLYVPSHGRMVPSKPMTLHRWDADGKWVEIEPKKGTHLEVRCRRW